MKTDSYCSQCGHKETCQQVYAKLGEYEGPSVVRDVLIAFVLPIAVFMASFAGFERLLRPRLSEPLLIAAAAAAALGVSVLLILIVKVLRNRFATKHCAKV